MTDGTLGTPLTPASTRALLLGAGELGKEVALELQRLGVEVVAVDRYANAPAMQVAHRSHVVDMLDPVALRAVLALEHPDLFPAPEDAAKAAVINCPAGWSCQISTANHYRAYKMEAAGFTLVDTGSAAGLDGAIARAFQRQEGWFGY